MSIASYLKGKHSFQASDGCYAGIDRKLSSFKPDVIGIYALSIDHHWALSLAARIKSIYKNVSILLGGPHPTFYADVIKDKNVDAICIGEGEMPVLNFLDSFENRKDRTDIASIWTKTGAEIHTNGIESLLAPEQIPIPDISVYRDFPQVLKSTVLSIVCSRGCIYDCYFCGNYALRRMHGHRFFRARKVGDIIEEIQKGRAFKPVRTITFQDDIFGIDKKWLADFLNEYNLRVKLPFYCLLRCEFVTEDMIDNLKKAGCFRVGIGVESGDEYIRNKILNKRLDNASIEKAAAILRDKKVEFHTFNMFGLPHENYKRALKTLELNIRLRPNPAKSIIFQPFPGTKFFLESEAVKKNILGPAFSMFKINHSYNKDFAKIQRLQKLFMLIVKFPLLKYLLPLLVILPMDYLYDKVSQLCWHFIYYRKITAKRNI